MTLEAAYVGSFADNVDVTSGRTRPRAILEQDRGAEHAAGVEPERQCLTPFSSTISMRSEPRTPLCTRDWRPGALHKFDDSEKPAAQARSVHEQPHRRHDAGKGQDTLSGGDFSETVFAGPELQRAAYAKTNAEEFVSVINEYELAPTQWVTSTRGRIG
jgi:hypothetical protein